MCHEAYIAAVRILEKRDPQVLQRAQEAICERDRGRGDSQLDRTTLPAPFGFVGVLEFLELVLCCRREAVGVNQLRI